VFAFGFVIMTRTILVFACITWICDSRRVHDFEERWWGSLKQREASDDQSTLAAFLLAASPSALFSHRAHLATRNARVNDFRMEADPPDLGAMVKDASGSFKKSVGALEEKLASIRAGRASPDLLNRVMVEYYGVPTPLLQLATVSVSSNTQLVVNVFDKNALGEVEKAISMSDVGLTPNVDGPLIRLNVPQMTAEARKEMVKLAKKMGEEGKVSVRNIRKKWNDAIKKAKKDVSEDSYEEALANLQKEVKATEKKMEKIVEKKTKDLTTL
jgi:ribosome recycling factor